MQKHIASSNIKYKDRRLLVSDLKAREILLSTDLIRWYIQHGLRITEIHQVIEFVGACPFKEFVKEVTDKRKEGSRDPNKAVLAQTYKLIGNSSYGSMLMNKLKFEKVKIVEGEMAARECVNSSQFKQLSMIGDDLFEIEESYSKLTLDIPIQIGFQILQLAKLRMLEFAYDFMAKYIERPLYQYLYCDTDSLYFSFSREKLEDCVKQELQREFTDQIKNNCKMNRSVNAFLSRTCCSMHQFEDDREPGLLKVEFSDGDTFIGLCSKTYVCKTRNNKIKLSCKGVNNSSILGKGRVIEMFKNTLSDKISREGINTGIRQYKMGMYSYMQKKDAFSYLYVKRVVDQNGIFTLPLNVTLDPVPTNMYPVHQVKELSLDFKHSFKYGKWRFRTLYQAIVYFKVMHDDPKNNRAENLEKVIRGCKKDIDIAYINPPYSSQWQEIMFWQIKDIIRKRLNQIPNAQEKLKATYPHSLLYCDRRNNVWCTGEEWRVIRWLSESDIPGRNYIGIIYENLRKEL